MLSTIHWLGLQLILLPGLVNARDVPHNLRNFYDAVRHRGHCSNALATGFYSSGSGSNTFAYCGDYLDSSGVIFLQGGHGALANMDVDCDGSGGGASNDGRCRYDLSPDLQHATSFRDVIANYSKGVSDLNPYVHPYIVFGNARGTRHKAGWRSFDPTEYGMRPLSVMAAVCPGYKLVFGIWGDTNGDDDAKPMIGEASLAFATACGGKQINGNSGIDEDTIMYLGFTGDEAVPGPGGADWAAKDFDTFEKSIEGLGNRLVDRVQVSGSDSSGSVGAEPRVGRTLVAVVVTLLIVWSLDLVSRQVEQDLVDIRNSPGRVSAGVQPRLGRALVAAFVALLVVWSLRVAFGPQCYHP